MLAGDAGINGNNPGYLVHLGCLTGFPMQKLAAIDRLQPQFRDSI